MRHAVRIITTLYLEFEYPIYNIVTKSCTAIIASKYGKTDIAVHSLSQPIDATVFGCNRNY